VHCSRGAPPGINASRAPNIRAVRSAATFKTTTKIETTSEMIEAGKAFIRSEVGGAELGGLFSVSDLA
jgi:hypothetical protein